MNSRMTSIGGLIAFIFFGSTAIGQKPTVGIDPFHLYEIRIQFSDPNWENRLTAYKSTDRKDKLSASVLIDGNLLDSVGIRFKGNSSFNNVKKQGSRKLPFSLDANEFIKDAQFPMGYKNVKLSNGFRDPSYLRDVFSYYIAGHYMPAPKSGFARVFVNGTYFGIYTLTQDIDKTFLQSWFKEHDGPFFKCDPDWQQIAPVNCPESDKCSLEFLGEDTSCYMPWYEMKSDSGWDVFVQFLERLNKEKPPLDSLLDIDRTLWMLAFNNLFVNLDSYSGRLCHNYFLYQSEDGRFIPLIWDLNLSVGGFRMAEKENLSDSALAELPLFLHEDNPDRPLISQLLRDPFYKKVYMAHIRTMLDEFIRNGKYKELISRWQSIIDGAVKADSLSLYSYEDFKKNSKEGVILGKIPIAGIEELMESRMRYLDQHPVFKMPYPAIVQKSAKRTKKNITFNCTAPRASKVHLYWRKEGSQVFQSKEMRAAINKAKNGRVFTMELPLVKNKIEYYLIAENEQHVMIIPRVASKSPLKI